MKKKGHEDLEEKPAENEEKESKIWERRGQACWCTGESCLF